MSGGGAGCNACGGDSLPVGTKVTLRRVSDGAGNQDQALKILLGVKSIVLKGILLKQLLDQKTSTTPIMIMMTNATTNAALAVTTDEP